MEVSNASVSVTMPIEMLGLLNVAVCHLSRSIKNGSFDAGTRKQKRMVIDALDDLNNRTSTLLNKMNF